MTNQGEPVKFVYLDFSKAFLFGVSSSACKEYGSNGNPPQDNPLSGGVSKEQNFSSKLGGYLPSEGIVKCGLTQGSVLGSLLFLIFF